MKTYESTRKLYRHLERGTARILAATVSERGGRWWVSFSIEVERQLPPTRSPERVIGIDVGITTLYTGATPEGDHVLAVANPRHLVAAQDRLSRAQRGAAPGTEEGRRPVEAVETGEQPGAEDPRTGRQPAPQPHPRDHDHAREELRPHRRRGPER